MRKKCIVCGAPLYDEPLYICNNMPATSQNLPTKETLCDDKPVDFNVCQCSGCGLVQFDCDPVDYYLDSTRAGERCDILVKLRQQQFKHLIDTYGLDGKKIVEIGAGKGGFLKTLKEMKEYSVSEYGIEHNSEFVKIAREYEGVNVVQGNPEDANFVIEGAPFDAFVSFAYPARLIDPNSMLQGVYNSLVDGGIGLIQVPSLEHLLQPGGFFDITADHIAYYSEETLRFLLQKNGFEVLEHGEVADLYIYAVVRKRKKHDLKAQWSDVREISNTIYSYVSDIVSNGGKVAAWCAGHFAFTVLSIAGIGDMVSYIIDNAQFKQDHFTPASHIPIVSSDQLKKEPVDVIIILGPIYIDEISNEIKLKTGDTTKIVAVNRGGIEELR